MSIQAPQCSSSPADESWRFVPDAILLGHRRAPQWVQARTPTVHFGLNSRKSVGVPFGSDSRYTANMGAEQVVDGAGSQRDGTLGCRRRTRYHRRRTSVGLHLKQGVFPKRDHHQQLV